MNTYTLERMLYSLIAERTGKHSWSGVIPAWAVLPQIVFSQVNSEDVSAVGSSGQILIKATYLVKVVNKGTSWDIVSGWADMIDQALDGGVHESDGYRLEVVRDRPVGYIEEENGIQYRHMGGYYTLYLYRIN
jgi:hypothetical protein